MITYRRKADRAIISIPRRQATLDRKLNTMNATHIRLAQRLALHAHKDQVQDDGQTPVAWYTQDVVNRMPEGDVEGRVVAWLHQVVESSSMSLSSLVSFFPPVITDAVAWLTRADCETYRFYLKNLKRNGSPVARRVKVNAILAKLDTATNQKEISKYKLALRLMAGDE